MKSTTERLMEIEEGNKINPTGWKGLPPVSDWAELDQDDKVWNCLGWIGGITITLCVIVCVALGLAYPYIH